MSVKLYTATGIELLVKFWGFPGGERGCRIEDRDVDASIIDVNFKSSDDIMDMLLLNDACKNLYGHDMAARIRYMPYARQDRVSAIGESHSLRVVAGIINSCNFSEIEIWDAHSDVTEALFPTAIIKSQQWLFRRHVDLSPDAILVSPDAGALKKIFKCANGVHDVVCAHKVRDARTGALSGCHIDSADIAKLHRRDVWIVDDICDGGGTFIQLINYIKDHTVPASINLYVTHGIFSKGKQVLIDAGFSQVVAANDMSTL